MPRVQHLMTEASLVLSRETEGSWGAGASGRYRWGTHRVPQLSTRWHCSKNVYHDPSTGEARKPGPVQSSG